MPGLVVAAPKVDAENKKVKLEKKDKKRKADDVEQPQAKALKTKQDSTPATSPEPQGDAALTDAEYLSKHEITSSGGQLNVLRSFAALDAPDAVKNALTAQGYSAPSPIQSVAWPIAATGRDLLGIAKTGSGKTCGYLVPAMIRILANRPAGGASKQAVRGTHKGCQALVMAPTRELAVQIHEQATNLGRSLGIRSVAVYGGAPKGPQIRDLHQGRPEIIIATPGRLQDMLAFVCQDGSGVMSLESTSVLVLDEADRMCDMGFEADIKNVVAQMNPERQTLFFTATWPKSVQRVAASILNNPVRVNVGRQDQLVANKDVKQHVQVVHQGDKYDKLAALMKAEHAEGNRTIIFCNKKYVCDNVEAGLWEAGYACGTIHGDKSQQDREWQLGQFKTGKMPVLIATDVAARGLDIKGVDLVVNYDFPTSGAEDYVHRIGRTGRAGATGASHTFFTQDDGKYAGELVKIMKDAGQEVPEALQAMVRSSSGGRGGGSWGNKGRGGSWGNKGRGGGGGGGWNKGGRGGGRRW